ncbi:lasso peptide biosynthesis B2 protein [Methanobacterium formicicum]|nr:lasso peptide biosynthesis B2 protein [Methanobacterium formicicum]
MSFKNLNSQDKKLVLKTFFLNYYVRLIVWIFPFQKVREITGNMGKRHNNGKINFHKLIWAVNVTSHFVIRSTCLTNALTGQILLQQHGYKPRLLIGVIYNEEFEAHAWLEYDKKVVLGKSEKDFTPLADIK